MPTDLRKLSSAVTAALMTARDTAPAWHRPSKSKPTKDRAKIKAARKQKHRRKT